MDAPFEERRRKRKRDVYTTRACNGCKVRKIKCSGNMPCSRCSDSRTICTYGSRSTTENNTSDNSVAPRAPQIDRLNELERFLQVVESGLAQLKPTSPLAHTSPPQQSNPSIRHYRHRRTSAAPRPGTANFEIMLQLALSNLDANGITPGSDEQVLDVNTAIDDDDTSHENHGDNEEAEADPHTILFQAGIFITSIMTETTAHMLLDTFACDAWTMYPCVDIEFVRQNLTALYRLASAPPLPKQMPNMSVTDIEIIKAVLLVAATCKGSSENNLVALLESSLIWSVESVFIQDAVSREDLIMACLLCMSYFARDNRQKAWRMAGFGARTALELGLDLAEHAHTDQRSLHDPSLHGLPKGSILFCCIYDLDLRSSLMVELPRALPGKLSQDHLHSMHPSSHLRNMLEMDRLAGEIQTLEKACGPGEEIPAEKIGYLEYRLTGVQKTYNSAIEANPSLSSPPTYAVFKSFSDLRANTLRCHLYRRGLLSVQKTARQSDSVENLIRCAEENVWLYEKVMKATTLPTLLQHTLHYFLITAIACMLLAVTYHPDTYRVRCQRPFLAGLQILESLPHKVRGSDSRRQYSMANLRRLATKVFPPADNENPGQNATVYRIEDDASAAVVGVNTEDFQDRLLTTLAMSASVSAMGSLQPDDGMAAISSTDNISESTDVSGNCNSEPAWPLDFDHQPLAMWDMMWDQRNWPNLYDGSQ